MEEVQKQDSLSGRDRGSDPKVRWNPRWTLLQPESVCTLTVVTGSLLDAAASIAGFVAVLCRAHLHPLGIFKKHRFGRIPMHRKLQMAILLVGYARPEARPPIPCV